MKMLGKLIKQENKLKEKQVPKDSEGYLSPKIDTENLLKNGCTTTDEYHEQIANKVDYSIEEADAALDVMIETTLMEFDAACAEIDDEVMSIENAKRQTIEAVRKIYEENN